MCVVTALYVLAFVRLSTYVTVLSVMQERAARLQEKNARRKVEESETKAHLPTNHASLFSEIDFFSLYLNKLQRFSHFSYSRFVRWKAWYMHRIPHSKQKHKLKNRIR